MNIQNYLIKCQENAHAVFVNAVKNCKAYGKFITENGIGTSNIKFKNIPLTDKYNYSNKYPFPERVIDGKEISDFYAFYMSSGSTDKSTIWPRDFNYDKSIELAQTEFFDAHFAVRKRKTLVVIVMGLGVYQAGMMHLKASWEGTVRGKISVVSPNLDIEKTVFLVENLHKDYDQTVFIGYPPAISDIVEYLAAKRKNFKNWNLKIAYTGEGESLEWRKETAEKIGGNLKDIVSFYGCTEAGMVGYETKEINKLLNDCIKNKNLQYSLFGGSVLPTVVDVDFMKKFVEIDHDEVVITVNQPIPLVRYNIHDRGELLYPYKIAEIYEECGVKYKVLPKKPVLVIKGRNIDRLFSIEDLKEALINASYNQYFDKEFQYSERKAGNTVEVKIILYKFKKVLFIEEIKAFISTLKNNMENTKKTDSKFSLIVKIKKSDEKLGYKSGKLKYLI